MLTKTKKRTNRWQVLALAALLLAGGSIAVPQAADAATTGSKRCDNGFFSSQRTCSLVVTAKRGEHPRQIKVTTAANGLFPVKVTYRVEDDARGNTLCSGTVTLISETIKCKFRYSPHRVRVTLEKPWGIAVTPTVKLY